MNCFVQFFQYGAKKKKPRDKNATLCPVTPYFSFPNFVMTYLICCAFSHKRRKKSLEKKIKWKKIQSIFPATHFFWLWAKPYLPLPPFSSKSKNIQLRNTKRKRDEAEAWKKQKIMKLASNSQQRSIRAWDFKGRTKNILLAHIG